MTLEEYLDIQFASPAVKAVLSGRRAGDADRINITPMLVGGKPVFQAAVTRGTKVFHENIPPEAVRAYIAGKMRTDFRQLQAEGETLAGTVLVSKKGKETVRVRGQKEEQGSAVRIQPHNRVKQYILREGTPVPFLLDLGVMTPEGKVIAAKQDKFRQINRFLEFAADIVAHLPKDRPARILDFGCGKSYLTFAMYYYLHELMGRDVVMTGLDLKEDVIAHCSALAVKYGYQNLSFRQGDVADYREDGPLDMMVTLHACDTATDYALAEAVRRRCGVILSVPCCQHEVRSQLREEDLPGMLRYGIIRERFAALATDALRAELLSASGYSTQILEFIDMAHTPKNLLIRAVYTGKKDEAAAGNAREMMERFHICPALFRLLEETG